MASARRWHPTDWPCTTLTPTASTCRPTPSPESAASDLRLALEQAFAAQHGGDATQATEQATAGFLGVSPTPQIVHGAVERYLAGTRVGEHGDGRGRRRRPTGGLSSALPLPIEYELAAVDDLGEALLTAAGVDPATVQFGTPLPDDLGAALDDGAQATSSGALQVGDRSLAPPHGPRRRRLVVGVGLPPAAADRRSAGLDRRRRFVPSDRSRRADLRDRCVRDRRTRRTRPACWRRCRPGPRPRQPGAQSTVAQVERHPRATHGLRSGGRGRERARSPATSTPSSIAS